MQIKEFFERDPTRKIEPIVKVTLHDPSIIRTELEEYVVTDQIKQYFQELTDKFIESRSGQQSRVCTWISGFFGSGKSHFLKLLGYVLENKIIELEDGVEVGSAEYFFNKHSLSKSTALILKKELKTKALFVNMLDFDRERGPDITRIIYRALLRDLDLSETFWISEFERMMQNKGIYSEFMRFVEEKEGKSWKEIRKSVVNARTIISQGLTKILPEDYPNLDIAYQSITDVKEEFNIDPRKLAERLLEETEKIGKDKGRIVILLDEVGLYIGTDDDRLTDLNAISERISEICGGKVWLYVTAQEALDEVIPKVGRKKGQFEWIKDRFDPISLTPENIDTVVKKRLLQKTSQKDNLNEIVNLYDKYSGSLALNITIKDPARDPQGLFTKLDDKDQFITSYPFAPYYIRLIQEILGNLRSKGSGEGLKITGRERAVLNIIKSILVSQFDDNILIENNLGKLATLNLVYDAINEELKAVKSSQQAVIEKDITGNINGLKVNSVAKVVFLLQQVNWIPCTLENIGAVLYSDVGLEQDQHLNTVKECLQKLQEEKWISVDDKEYKFLTEVERTFEQTVAAQNVTEHEKRELSTEILKDVLKSFKSYNYDGKPFNVHFFADDHDISSKGHLNLKFYSPYSVLNTEQIDATKLSESIAYQDTIYWLSKPDKKFDKTLEKVISIKKALEEKDKTSLSEEERRILDKPRNEMENLKEDELPRLFKNAVTEGKIFFRGEETALSRKKSLQEIFNTHMKELVENLFTEYHHAAFRLNKDEDIGKILDWRGSALPGIYKELELVGDQGILTDRPVAARILSEIRRRDKEGLEKSGKSLEEFFDSPPYGWDARIIRLVLATLFKNGAISIDLDGKEYYSASEQSSKDAFTNSRLFRRAQFSLGQVISPEDREKASKLISKIFGEHTGHTTDEIDQSLKKAVVDLITDCGRIKNSTKSFPTTNALSSLSQALENVNNSPTKTRRIFTFLDDEINQEISRNLIVLEKMIDFEGNIETYQNYLDFTDVAIQLINTTDTSEEDVNSLKSDLKAEDFYDRWSDITTKASSLMERYKFKYIDLHQERNNKVTSALEYLNKHEANQIIDESEKKNIFSKLTQMKCDSEDFKNITKKPFRCKACRTALSTLNVELETIDGRKRDVKRELDKFIQPDEPKELKGFKEVKEVKSMDDIQDIIDRMQDLVEKAEEAGKKVQANIELEVR